MAKKLKPRKKKAGPMLEQRNRIRGLLAASKSTEVVIAKGNRKGKDVSARASKFQSSLAAILIASRKSLRASQYEGFLSWLELQTSMQVAPLNAFGAMHSELIREVLTSHPLPLPKEVLWIVSRLVQHKDHLAKFVFEKNRLEDLYWIGDWPKIKEQLALIERVFGRTLWILEANISLQQEFVGLEAQKKIVSAERKMAPRSLSAYLAYHLSIRNEPTTVLSRHLEDVSTRIDRLGVSSVLKSFLKYSLLDQYAITDTEAGEALQVAQGLSELDLYETLIGICQVLAVRNQDYSSKIGLSQSLERLRCIGDERVEAILRMFRETAPQNTLSEKNSLIETPPLKAALYKLKRNSRDARTAIQAAAQLKTVRKPNGDPTAGPRWPIVIRQIAAVLRFDSTYDSDLNAVERYFFNHRFFTTALVCIHLLRAELAVVSGDAAHHRRRAMISRPMDLYFCAGDVARVRMLLDPTVFSGKDQPRWVTVLSILTELQTAIADGDLGIVVTQLAQLYLNNTVPLSALPLRSGIGLVRWHQLKQYRDRLSLAIALHLCWRTTDSDLAATNLRFAFEEFLDVHNIRVPADLIKHQDKFDVNELIYFLNHVCVVNVMDMSQRISSSRAAEEERQQVCAALCELDPGNRSDYEVEIVGIVHSLSLQEGRTVVDSSRVHVDTGALRSWASREMESSFHRYTALVRAGVGMAEDFDVLMRDIRSADTIQQKYMATPESEADTVLIEIIMDMRDRFLLDPHHGLDSYLSRRVRHHSMTGYLRGPVEEETLITSRNTKSSRYAENTYWVNRLGGRTPGDRARIANCFESFAEEFDRIILTLKNELFHVHSTDYPKGLFNVPISAPMIHLARSAVQTDMSLDGFCSVCFSLFWGSLDGSLQEAQRRLRNDTKRELSATFQRLRASLRKAVQERDRYDDAAVIIGKASENVQGGIDKMAEWFVRTEIQQTNIQYSIDKVLEIAIASALSSHRPFDPLVTKDITCNYHVRAGDLIVVAEIILTALGNVKAYGGARNQPRVNISAHCSAGTDTLLLRVENDVEPAALSVEARKRVDHIRCQIQDGSYVDMIRLEGGSGLMKIAGTANQSKRGRIDFDFIGENRFFVEITLSFIQENIQENLESPDIVVGRLVG